MTIPLKPLLNIAALGSVTEHEYTQAQINRVQSRAKDMSRRLGLVHTDSTTEQASWNINILNELYTLQTKQAYLATVLLHIIGVEPPPAEPPEVEEKKEAG